MCNNVGEKSRHGRQKKKQSEFLRKGNPMNKPNVKCLHCGRKINLPNAWLEFKNFEWMLGSVGKFAEPQKGARGGPWLAVCKRCSRDKSPAELARQWGRMLSEVRECFARFLLGTSSAGVTHTPQGFWCDGCYGLIPDGETIDPDLCDAGHCQGHARLNAADAARRTERHARRPGRVRVPATI